MTNQKPALGKSRPNGHMVVPADLPGLAEAVRKVKASSHPQSLREHFPEVGLFNDRIDCACGWHANPATADDWWDHIESDLRFYAMNTPMYEAVPDDRA